MTKYIQQILKRCNEGSFRISNVISKYSCVMNSIHYQNSAHILNLLSSTVQGNTSAEKEHIIQINKKEDLKWKLNIKEVMNLFPTFNKNSSCLMRFHSKSNLLDKTTKQNVAKSEMSKENLEEAWGGPDALKLIIFLNENFDEVINQHESVLVFFSASWCPHCLKLRKPYGKAALLAKEANLSVAFATFDVNINPDIADANGVVGIPMIKYYKKGKFISNYRGKRTSDDLFEFVKNPPQLQPESKKADV